jgi:D-glycero-D-manno-heptose 1,7-bisphosphate phosphatase
MTPGSLRAVFLDRDGVLNEVLLRRGKPHPPASLSDLRVASGAPECLAELKRQGFLLVVVTNQPDVSRGTQTKQAVEEINSFLSKHLPIDHTYVCYHDDPDRCTCRKPQPGLLEEAARNHKIELTKSFLIGDRWRDVEAGRRANCQTVFINYNYAERRPDSPTFEAKSLRAAVDWILANA